MESSFSRIDSVLNDVDKYLEENKLYSDEEYYSSSKKSQKRSVSSVASPIEKAKNDIDDLLRRANIEPTTRSYLPPKFKLSKEEDEDSIGLSQEDSFDYRNAPNVPGSPSYDFMKNMQTRDKPSSPLFNTKASKTPFPTDNFEAKSSFISTSSNQSAEQIEAEMLAAENAQLYEELMKYKGLLQTVVNKNSNMLKQIEANEVRLYSIRGKK